MTTYGNQLGQEVWAGAGNWYAARLLYAVGLEHGLLSIEEDFWLFCAESAEAALSQALAGAESAEAMGNALIEGPSAIRELGFPELSTLITLGEPEGPRTGDHEGHGGMPGDRYTMYRFLGVRHLCRIGNRLGHGTVLGTYRCCAQPPTPTTESLSAFDPAGPAYTGASRDARNARLYEKYKWYLAEQLFQVPPGSSDAAGATFGRFVLLSGDSPKEASSAAMADGESHSAIAGSIFVGLRGLSLITDAFRDACSLGTDEYDIQLEAARELVKTREELLGRVLECGSVIRGAE